MPRALADAFVRIRPDVSGFRAEVDAKLTAAMRGAGANVMITANTQAAIAKMTALRAQMEELGRKVTSARLIADDKSLQLDLAKIQTALQAWSKKTSAKKVTLEGADKVETQLMTLTIAADKYMSLALDKRINLDSADAQHKLAALIVGASDLSRRAYAARVGLTGDAAEKMAILISELENVSGKIWDIRLGVHDADIVTAGAALEKLTAQFERLTYKDIPAATASTTRLWGVWGALSARVALFGGLATVSGWHIAIDGVIEALAVLIPAITVVAAGLTAFGIAGADAAKEVYNQFLALHTVSDATGKTIAPMTGSLEKLHDAVRPQVFQLLGDAIQVASAKTGLFNKLALETGSVLDKLVAHLTVIITSAGPGLNTFLAAGAKDAAQLGRFLVNIGDAILNLIKVTQETHIADFLLQGLVAASKLLDLITKLPTPLLAIVVGLHGLYLWGGLAATGILRLINPLVKLATTAGGIHAADQAVKGLAENAGPLTRLKAAFSDISTGTQNLPARFKSIGLAGAEAGTRMSLVARAANLIKAVPIAGWVGVAVVAFTALTLVLGSVRSAAVQFASSLVDAVGRATNAQVLGVLNKGLADLNMRLAQAQTGAQGMSDATANMSRAMARQNAATNSAASNIFTYEQAQSKLTATQQTVRANLKYLEQQYGVSQPQAITLATAAGVKLNQSLTDQSMAAKTARTQIEGLVQGYGAMSAKGGQLGNDMEVLKAATTDQYKAIQQLNQGWDTFIGNVTATQSGFDNVALGFNTLNDSASTASNTLGKAHDKIEGLGKAIDGLTPKDIALNSAFTAQVMNLNTLFDSFRTAGLQNDLFVRGVKDAIAPMTKYARGSQEATAQLVGLAQEAGFNGPASMKALTKWLGNTGDATKNLKDITNQATIQEALLTTSMKGQGDFIANSLVKDINQGIIGYNNVADAARKWGNAIAEDGRQSAAARKDRTNLIADIIASGTAAGDSTRQIAAMITKVTGIPKSKAIQLIMNGVGAFKIESGLQNKTNNPPLTGAAGMLVSGGIAGRDSVHALLMPGEVVVPTRMVKGGAVDHLRGSIPGFAAGGQVGANPSLRGNVSVLTGDYAVAQYNAFTRDFTGAMAASMRSALKAAEAAAAAANAFGAAGPGGGAPSANAALARRLMPSWASGAEWSAWNYVAMRESGWNQFARNPSSGAYGIPQALPPSKMGPAANPPQSNPSAQISWMIGYIRGRYGDPIGAANHERSFNWYSGGTDGAAKGWAMVGERGPELVNFHGGETVLPNSMSMAVGGMIGGYAKGTHHHKKPLDTRLENALHYTRSNRNEPVRYTRIEEHLEAIRTYMHNQSVLVRFGHLKGAALSRAKAGLRHDEADYKAVLKEIRPYTETRGWLRGLRGSLDNQEKHLGKAIAVATNQGKHGLAARLAGKLHWYTKTDKELGTWLDRLLPVAGPSPSGRKVARQNRRNAAFIEDAIGDAIRAAGLPVVPYGSYDKGGWLPKGLSLAYNGLGRPERVGSAPVSVVMQFSNSNAMFDKFMTQWIQHAVQVKGGGDVQVAFGRVN